jgi:hypothetical protein
VVLGILLFIFYVLREIILIFNLDVSYRNFRVKNKKIFFAFIIRQFFVLVMFAFVFFLYSLSGAISFIVYSIFVAFAVGAFVENFRLLIGE